MSFRGPVNAISSSFIKFSVPKTDKQEFFFETIRKKMLANFLLPATRCQGTLDTRPSTYEIEYH